MNKKILAIASMGGHWVQLQRLKEAFEPYEVIYVKSTRDLNSVIKKENIYYIIDGNRWSKIKLIKVVFQVWKIIATEKPDFVITTGAAPGLMALIISRFWGAKTIWIDSIANAKKVSMSGRIAKRFATLHLTQWPSLASGETQFKGNVIS